ncbi:hypothetical protein RIF25_11155 [Thermosynechococcaceae cyanobacterium BACA0444]|uniref:Uncharacterized protein n=1 Tax=Pseudocalidococcus azoricus BACA0444 TaxID=2918990 RepID=A0AAE4FUQ5_9CYAN|nr:hypothetical protein [Pseudocalidococcus azoricus]MDS3861366.1 hypothetical protein [Pseudocalidococcus azoricus BACA0444]
MRNSLADCYPLPVQKVDEMQQLLGEEVLIKPADYEYFLEIPTAS